MTYIKRIRHIQSIRRCYKWCRRKKYLSHLPHILIFGRQNGQSSPATGFSSTPFVAPSNLESEMSPGFQKTHTHTHWESTDEVILGASYSCAHREESTVAVLCLSPPRVTSPLSLSALQPCLHRCCLPSRASKCENTFSLHGNTIGRFKDKLYKVSLGLGLKVVLTMHITGGGWQ